MFWFTELAKGLDLSKPQIINDSKTPSGRVHVGALRGVLIHDAVYRVLRARDANVRYLYGVDDYDPVDEIPAGQGEHFTQYLGQPLCNVPPPPGSTAPDMATHFISEFFEVFAELGVAPEIYRMRDVYRAGRFNDAIDRILSRAADVRRIYKEVSGSVRPDDWYPFQAVCESCGRIGTTQVTAYENGLVRYTCKPNLVKWAKGCGHVGEVSPFDGRGKLPWKLEWVAKWQTFGVTIEGSGKDHTTKGGSRDVGNHCFKELFGGTPPENIPYEFFLVGGAKMSSSKGIGASAREMATFLPPEILRFLMLSTQPKSPVDFRVSEEYFVKSFNDFDRAKARAADPKARDEERELYDLCEVTPAEDVFDANFQLVVALVQLPHLDAAAELEKRAPRPLTPREKERLGRRIAAARVWLERYASDADKMTIRAELPASATELGAAERGFLHLCAAELGAAPWEDDALQSALFTIARKTPIENAKAFKAIYRVLLDRAQGPRAGSFVAFLDKDFVLRRFAEVPYDEAAFLRETAVSVADAEKKLTADGAKLRAVSALSSRRAGDVSVAELSLTLGEHSHVLRVLADGEDPDTLAARLAAAYGSTT